MSNPSVQHISVPDTAVQVVSEPGKYRLQAAGGPGCYVGGANVSVANAATVAWFINSSSLPVDVVFDADAEVYAVSAAGQTTTLKVVRYF